MTALRLILGDQLSRGLSSLRDLQTGDTILLCEVMEEATYVAHHPKKIAFLFAAMRHFAQELKAEGLTVRYVELADPANTGSLAGEVKRAVGALGIDRIVVTEPGEYRLKTRMQAWSREFDLPVEMRPDDRFLCTSTAFSAWARGKKQLRMEFFCREMRRRYRILLEADGTPTGGRWNYDHDNRKPPIRGLTSPRRLSHPKSAILKAVLSLVRERFPKNFGDLEPFHYAVTREQALMELDDFIDNILARFGDHQDAMVKGEPYLYHSLLSSYLNAGLLLPLEICHRAEAAYRAGRVPLNAAEGFIRQILGWREYVRGIYWLKMPDYASMNHLDATRPLPDFYWGAPTQMACVAEAVAHTREHAYSHHIQRLMVTGNFALIAGLDVRQVQDWYLAVYSDAYEWVEMPNTLGMALFGDGGIVGSKPYAASGKYIHRMSNFCSRCQYRPEEMLGDDACPFNALYWDFFARNRARLEANQRLPYVYSTWEKFGAAKQQAIRRKAADTLLRMKAGTL